MVTSSHARNGSRTNAHCTCPCPWRALPSMGTCASSAGPSPLQLECYHGRVQVARFILSKPSTVNIINNIQQSISTSMARFDNILIALAQVDTEVHELMTKSFNDNAEANELKRTFLHMSLETRTDMLSGSSHPSGFCGPRSWHIEV